MGSAKYSCCATKYFCETFTTKKINNAERGKIKSYIPVKKGEILNIITIIPISETIDEITCDKLCDKL